MGRAFLKKHPALFALARQRQQETPIQLQIMAAGLPQPTPEYEFARNIGRGWKADLAWPEWKILFEQEGSAFGNVIHVGVGAWTTKRTKAGSVRVNLEPNAVVRLGGRHNTGAGMQADCEKYSWAAILGYTVVRATTTMIRDGEAITLLEAAFKAKGYKSKNAADQQTRNTLR